MNNKKEDNKKMENKEELEKLINVIVDLYKDLAEITIEALQEEYKGEE